MADVENVTIVPSLPPRSPDAHKGDFGRVLVIAGSRGMSGAAALCASAALRAGAGLVKAAVPAEILPIVASHNPCYMTVALPSDGAGHLTHAAHATLLGLCEAHDVVAIGPGLGQTHDLSLLVLELIEKVTKPMVIDADGSNALVGHVYRMKAGAAPRIITPHPGEFARLLGVDTKTVQARRQELAVQVAAERGLIVVLKGHDTIVTDGRRVYANTTGNPGMATGGAGDVLTGLIAALVGQGLAPFEAAQLGVYLHGLAGDLARDQIGETSLIATDLLDFLPAAFRHD